MKKVKKVINVFTGHTLEEYKSLYDIDNRIHIDKETIDKFHKKYPKAKKDSPLEGRSWWLIDDTYYEINPLINSPIKVKKIKSGLKIAIASIIGAIAIGGVGFGSYYIINKAWNSSPEPVPPGPTPTEKWYKKTDWYKYTSEATTEDIGIECTIKVNNVDHAVRLIGIDEDVDADNNKIHTTWEFKNTISDANGYALGTIYNDNDNDYTHDPYNIYEDSSIRKALTGQGNGTIYWSEINEQTWSSTYKNMSVLDMIDNSDVKNCFKEAKKSVATYESGNYVTKDISDKLFLPSIKEFGFASDYAIETNETYSFYKDGDHSKTNKKQVNCDAIMLESKAPTMTEGTTLYSGNDIRNNAGCNQEEGKDTRGAKYWSRSSWSIHRDFAFFINFGGSFSDYEIVKWSMQVAPLFFI